MYRGVYRGEGKGKYVEYAKLRKKNGTKTKKKEIHIDPNLDMPNRENNIRLSESGGMY